MYATTQPSSDGKKGVNHLDKKTMTIIAVVAIVAIVIVAVAVVSMNPQKDTSKSDVRYALQVMGNADEDTTITSKDVTIIEEIIAGSLSFKDYPYADANNDGKVDKADVDLVKNIVERKNGTKMYVVNVDVSSADQSKYVSEVTYPLSKIVPYGVNIVEPIVAIDGGKNVAGYFAKGYPVQEASMMGEDLKGGSRSIGDAAWKNFLTLDSKVHVDAFVISYDNKAQLLDTYVDDLVAAGIPLISYAAANPDGEVTAALTIGFLMGGECEKLGKKYADIYENVLDKVDAVTKKKAEANMSNYLSMIMYSSICQNDSTYNNTGAAAGGIPYYKVDSDFAQLYKGTGSTALSTVEGLSNIHADKVLNYRSIDQITSSSVVKEEIIETWEHENSKKISAKMLFEHADLDNDDFYFINNVLASPIKVAYSAHILYSDSLSKEWANSILQEFIDSGFTSYKGKTITENFITIFNYQDYLDAKA